MNFRLKDLAIWLWARDFFFNKNESILPCFCSVTDHRWRQKVLRKNVAQEAQPNASLMFSPYFDVFCDLLLHVQTHGNKQSTYFMWGEKKIGNGNVMRFDKTFLVFIVSTVLSWSAGHDYCGLLDGWWASRMFFRFIYLLFLLIDCVFLIKVMS